MLCEFVPSESVFGLSFFVKKVFKDIDHLCRTNDKKKIQQKRDQNRNESQDRQGCHDSHQGITPLKRGDLIGGDLILSPVDLYVVEQSETKFENRRLLVCQVRKDAPDDVHQLL